MVGFAGLTPAFVDGTGDKWGRIDVDTGRHGGRRIRRWMEVCIGDTGLRVAVEAEVEF
jgi:hypothetical protein